MGVVIVLKKIWFYKTEVEIIGSKYFIAFKMKHDWETTCLIHFYVSLEFSKKIKIRSVERKERERGGGE